MHELLCHDIAKFYAWLKAFFEPLFVYSFSGETQDYEFTLITTKPDVETLGSWYEVDHRRSHIQER